MGKCISRRVPPADETEAREEGGDDGKVAKSANGQVEAKDGQNNAETQDKAETEGSAGTQAESKTSASVVEKSDVAQENSATTPKTICASDGNNTDEQSNEGAQVPKEEVIDIDVNDPEVQKAATAIQASFRGHIARKHMKESKEEKQESPESNVVDIDLNDPEVNKAAVKIQSSFRGHITRKHLQEK